MWYSYAIVRVVPRVERGEFLNVGVVLFARERGYLKSRFEVDPARLEALAPGIDLAAVERHLQTFQAVCDGDPAGGPIAAMPASERFHWLVSPRSTIIQTSPVHPGRSDHPEQAVQDLLAEFVRPPAGPDPNALSGCEGTIGAQAARVEGA